MRKDQKKIIFWAHSREHSRRMILWSSKKSQEQQGDFGTLLTQFSALCPLDQTAFSPFCPVGRHLTNNPNRSPYLNFPFFYFWVQHREYHRTPSDCASSPNAIKLLFVIGSPGQEACGKATRSKGRKIKNWIERQFRKVKVNKRWNKMKIIYLL